MSNKKKVILIIFMGLLAVSMIISGFVFYFLNGTDTSNDNIPEINDITEPELILMADSNEKRDYYINLFIGEERDNFDPMDYIGSVSDDISSEDAILIQCTDTLDTTKSTQYISYTATDEVGNVC